MTVMGATVHTGDLGVWVEHRGQGPEVLLIAGLGDPVEAWQFQLDGLADSFHLIAFDNRGAGAFTAARRAPVRHRDGR